MSSTPPLTSPTEFPTVGNTSMQELEQSVTSNTNEINELNNKLSNVVKLTKQAVTSNTNEINELNYKLSNVVKLTSGWIEEVKEQQSAQAAITTSLGEMSSRVEVLSQKQNTQISEQANKIKELTQTLSDTNKKLEEQSQTIQQLSSRVEVLETSNKNDSSLILNHTEGIAQLKESFTQLGSQVTRLEKQEQTLSPQPPKKALVRRPSTTSPSTNGKGISDKDFAEKIKNIRALLDDSSPRIIAAKGAINRLMEKELTHDQQSQIDEVEKIYNKNTNVISKKY